MVARFTPGFRLALAAVDLLAAGPAAAQTYVIDCPAEGVAPALTLRFDGGMLAVSDGTNTAELPAALYSDPSGIFTIDARGEAVMPMPDLAAMEACVAERAAANGTAVTGNNAITYEVVNCRIDLAAGQAPQPVTAAVNVTSFDPASAEIFITRSYTVSGGLMAEPLEIPEFPLRSCVLTKE